MSGLKEDQILLISVSAICSVTLTEYTSIHVL